MFSHSVYSPTRNKYIGSFIKSWSSEYTDIVSRRLKLAYVCKLCISKETNIAQMVQPSIAAACL